MFLASKIFKVTRKGVWYDVVTSNILRGDFLWLGHIHSDSMSVGSSSGDVS